MVKQGYKDWYFLTADYAFGAALQRDALAVITAGGGRMIGSVRHPVNSPDFSSYLLQADAAKPQILGIANGGNDMVNAIKTIKEFGIDQHMKVASLLMFITDVHSIGLKDAGGLLFTTSWDWNLNDESRAFGRRPVGHRTEQERSMEDRERAQLHRDCERLCLRGKRSSA